MSLREWHSCSAQASWKKRDQIRLSSILFPDRLYLWRPHFSAHILPIFCRVHALVQMTRPSRRRKLSSALSKFLLPLGQGHVSAHAPRVDSCVPAFHALAIASPGQPSPGTRAIARAAGLDRSGRRRSPVELVGDVREARRARRDVHSLRRLEEIRASITSHAWRWAIKPAHG